MSFIEKIYNLESLFEEDRAEPFVIKEGVGAVMVSAPHSVSQTRAGRIKQAEPQTGALALLLRENLKCPVICKTANSGDDANFDMVSSYKTALAEYIKNNEIAFLLDLHQLSQKREIAIDIGTGSWGYKRIPDQK